MIDSGGKFPPSKPLSYYLNDMKNYKQEVNAIR